MKGRAGVQVLGGMLCLLQAPCSSELWKGNLYINVNTLYVFTSPLFLVYLVFSASQRYHIPSQKESESPGQTCLPPYCIKGFACGWGDWELRLFWRFLRHLGQGSTPTTGIWWYHLTGSTWPHAPKPHLCMLEAAYTACCYSLHIWWKSLRSIEHAVFLLGQLPHIVLRGRLSLI